MGWTPLPIKKATESWIYIIKQRSENIIAVKDLQSDQIQRYTQLILAIYIQANLLHKVIRQIICKQKKNMAKELTEHKILEDDMQSNAGSVSDLDLEFRTETDPTDPE